MHQEIVCIFMENFIDASTRHYEGSSVGLSVGQSVGQSVSNAFFYHGIQNKLSPE